MALRELLPAILRKELAWVRRNAVPLTILLIVFPGSLAVGAATFGTVFPTDAPVAVVPQEESVTSAELTITRGAVAPFSSPVTYHSQDAAFRALDREQVYAVVTVPPGITDPENPAVFNLYVSGSVVPYHQASQAVVSVMNYFLRTQLPDDIEVSVKRHVIGTERTLSSYLVPTFLFTLLAVIALLYLPYNLAHEEVVIDRLRVETSLTSVVVWKLLVFGGLLAIPVAIFHLVSSHLGYGVAITSPGALLVTALTFWTLGSVGLGLTLATGFASLGRLLSLGLLLFVLGFSGLFYPAGFFSPIRRELVRTVPTHYAMVALRGFALRDATIEQYAEWLVGFCGLAILAGLFLRGSIAVYEWRT